MGLSRRGFLGLFGAAAAAPFVVNAELFTGTTSVVVNTTQEAPMLPAGTTWTGDGRAFRYIRAHKDTRRYDLVYVEGRPVGVATCDIAKGNYGFVQVYGPVKVAMAYLKRQG